MPGISGRFCRLWAANASNGCYGHGPGSGGQGSFLLSFVPGDAEDRRVPLPAAARVLGRRQREAPVEGPLSGVGLGKLGSTAAPHRPGSGQPGVGGQGYPPLGP